MRRSCLPSRSREATSRKPAGRGSRGNESAALCGGCSCAAHVPQAIGRRVPLDVPPGAASTNGAVGQGSTVPLSVRQLSCGMALGAPRRFPRSGVGPHALSVLSQSDAPYQAGHPKHADPSHRGIRNLSRRPSLSIMATPPGYHTRGRHQAGRRAKPALLEPGQGVTLRIQRQPVVIPYRASSHRFPLVPAPTLLPVGQHAGCYGPNTPRREINPGALPARVPRLHRPRHLIHRQ